MKISIITTCYNREKTIASALDSFIAQDYKNKEYIIIDGDSKDKSMEIITQYKDSIDVLVSEKDAGIYNALNKGIKNCSGDIIGLLHSDDFFYNNQTLTKIADCFQKTGADIVYGNGLYVDELNISRVKRIYPSKNFKKNYLKWGWIPLHTTIFVKKEIFEKYGLYREDYRIASDYDISLRWFRNPNIKKHFLDEYIVKMRLGGKSTDMNQQKKKSAEDLQIIQEHQLLGKLTLFFKIFRKIPQYLLPRIIKYK